MRIAFVGKGGAGKSVLAATTARLLARRGHEVLVVDSDPLPGLALSLGIGGTDATLPASAIEEHEVDGRRAFKLSEGMDPASVVEQFAIEGPDGVRVLQHGKMHGPQHPEWSTQAVLRQVLQELPDRRWTIVADLPGGTRQPFFGWASYVERYLAVVEPSAKGALAARRLNRLRSLPGSPTVSAVLNKVDAAAGDDPTGFEAQLSMDVLAVVPRSAGVAQAERAGKALLDAAPEDPVVAALESLVDALQEGERTPRTAGEAS